jgi:hypothetical protein
MARLELRSSLLYFAQILLKNRIEQLGVTRVFTDLVAKDRYYV